MKLFQQFHFFPLTETINLNRHTVTKCFRKPKSAFSSEKNISDEKGQPTLNLGQTVKKKKAAAIPL